MTQRSSPSTNGTSSIFSCRMGSVSDLTEQLAMAGRDRNVGILRNDIEKLLNHSGEILHR